VREGGTTSPTGAAADLSTRFLRALNDDQVLSPGDTLVVAFSGGVDSAVLLHLLRFAPNLPTFHLVAAHYDHQMRPGSKADRRWAEGLCRAWGVPFHWAAADPSPSSEEDARLQRYGFLSEVEREVESCWTLTAHHGDDQAETVLFRIVRGTGLRGLAGIPTERLPGLYRPILPFSREELLVLANEKRVLFRNDPTNLDLTYPRNFLRHQILPQLEQGPAPRVRESLRRLARLAGENERAWESLLPNLLKGVLVEEEGRWFIVRSGLLAHHPAVQTRLLREIFRKSGIELNEAGTRTAVEFTRSGVSGRSLSLPGGLSLTRAFDRFSLGGRVFAEEEKPLILRGPTEGSGDFGVGGIGYQAVWGPTDPGGYDSTVTIPLSSVVFPLTIRGWEPGDKIHLSYGTKKLKKVFSEARLPVEERSRTPVLVDGKGRVLWVVGLAFSTIVQAQSGPGVFFLGIRNAHTI